MVDAFGLIQAALSVVTLVVAALVAYRAFRAYGVAKNLNLLLLGLGFSLLCVFFFFTALGFLGHASRTYPPNSLLGRYYFVSYLEVIAYLLVMLAYVIRPKSIEGTVPLVAVTAVALTFELFIVALLLVVVISVWSVYRSTPTASTALVLASFSLLFLLHAITALLLFAPRLMASGSAYYEVMQMLAFALLYMAIGHHQGKNRQRGTSESA